MNVRRTSSDDRTASARSSSPESRATPVVRPSRVRIRAIAALDQPFEHLRSSRLGQQFELGDRVLGTHLTPSRPHADQHDALEEQLAILNLSDVGQFGRHPRDSTERKPIFQVLLASVEARSACWPWLETLDEQLVIWCG